MNGKKPIAIRPELLETDPMHADMLRYDQAFHHPTDPSLVIFPHFRLKGAGGLYPDKITVGRWSSFTITLNQFSNFNLPMHICTIAQDVDDCGIHNLNDWVGYVFNVPGYTLRKITLEEYLKEYPKKIVGWREV
jgi:hypothetical protein